MRVRKLSRFAGICAFLCFGVSPVARAQVTTTWTGLGTGNLWTDPGNWNPSVPTSLDTAQFIDNGNGVNSISLGGAAQPVSTLSFSSTPASYTLGVLSSGDQFDVTAGGGITLANTVANPQSIDAVVNYLGAGSITNNTTSSSGALTINGNMTLGGALTLTGAGGSQTLLLGNIGGSGSVSVPVATVGSIRFSGANTYAGGTTMTGPAAHIQIGSSTVGASGSITSGPFGTGTITFNSATPSILEPFGGDRTIANNLTFTNGVFVGTASGDTAHNLTFTAASTTLGKVLTNNLTAGGVVSFGTPGTTSTLALGGGTIQSQPGVTGASGGVTIVNDQLTGTGTVTIKQGGTVYVMNGTNTNSGNVNVTGTGVANAANVVGVGGTVAGTGRISNGGTVTISSTSTTAGTQGGMLAPGSIASPVGTLSAGGAMAWDPVGRYIFDYNGNDSTTGGSVNDLMAITGNLNLGNLGGANGVFDIDLNPTTLTSSASPLTYTIATVGGTVNNSAGALAANTDLTTLFSFSGSFVGTPTAAVGADGKSVQVTFTPATVPEPGCLALLGFAGLGLLRRRR